MIRIVIENLLLLLLPTLIYFSYVYLTRRHTTTRRQALNDAPLIWLFIAGVICAISVIAYFGTLSGGRPGDKYVPSVFKDGKIVPGHLEKRNQPDQ